MKSFSLKLGSVQILILLQFFRRLDLPTISTKLKGKRINFTKKINSFIKEKKDGSFGDIICETVEGETMSHRM